MLRVWVWWELVWVCASHHMLHVGMSAISVPVPFHWYAHPKTPYDQFWNNEHPHVFAVHHTRTTSERNYTVQLRYALKKEAHALHGTDTVRHRAKHKTILMQ